MPYQTKFEMTVFEKMLSSSLTIENIERTLAEKDHYALILEMEDEAERIILEFKNVLCRQYEEFHMERYIRMHQQGMIKLMNKASGYLADAGNLCQKGVAVYQAVIRAQESLLGYLETDLDRYFDRSLAVPDTYRCLSAEQLGKQALVISGKMKGKGVDPALQLIVLDFLGEHCALDSCSYQELMYVKLMVSSLLRLLSVNGEKDWNKKLMLELLYLNFNKSSFFTYCRKQIAAAVDEQRELKSQRQKFAWYMKEIRKLQVKPNVGYNTMGRAGVVELLTGYINTERAYLTERSKGLAAEPVKSFSERADHFAFKLPLSLSVPELGLISQLFIDARVFITEQGQIMTIMKFFAANVTTAGTTDMSAESLYKVRKKAEPKVCDAIEGILEEMLRVLRDVYMMKGKKGS